jgi:hypothetical protein
MLSNGRIERAAAGGAGERSQVVAVRHGVTAAV